MENGEIGKKPGTRRPEGTRSVPRYVSARKRIRRRQTIDRVVVFVTFVSKRLKNPFFATAVISLRVSLEPFVEHRPTAHPPSINPDPSVCSIRSGPIFCSYARESCKTINDFPVYGRRQIIYIYINSLESPNYFGPREIIS